MSAEGSLEARQKKQHEREKQRKLLHSQRLVEKPVQVSSSLVGESSIGEMQRKQYEREKLRKQAANMKALNNGESQQEVLLRATEIMLKVEAESTRLFFEKKLADAEESLRLETEANDRARAEAQAQMITESESQLRHATSQRDAAMEKLVCPILQEITVDPAIAADGHTYERSAIEAWFSRSTRSPLTNEPLPHTDLQTNWIVKDLLEALTPQSNSPGPSLASC